jgi:hypothetical protein
MSHDERNTDVQPITLIDKMGALTPAVSRSVRINESSFTKLAHMCKRVLACTD